MSYAAERGLKQSLFRGSGEMCIRIPLHMELITPSGRLFTMTGSSISGGSVSITEIDSVTVQFSERPILAYQAYLVSRGDCGNYRDSVYPIGSI